MPQQLLHPPQVKAGSHEVNGKAVPERMGMNFLTDRPTIPMNDIMHLLPG